VTLGTLLTLEGGEKAVVVKRSMRDVWRGKDAPFVSQSMQTGDAGWSVDVTTLRKMHSMGIERLIIEVREDKALYETTFALFKEHSHARNQRIKNGAAQRTLGFEHFEHSPGVVKV
jgi:hypothetical protein